jgi:hypothetical protein
MSSREEITVKMSEIFGKVYEKLIAFLAKN